MLFSFPANQSSSSGMKHLFDVQKASNGWVVTVIRDGGPSVEDVKSQIEGISSLMKHFQQSGQEVEAWKQSQSEDDISTTAHNLMRPQKPLQETFLFLDKEELIAFINDLL
jgi:uncharacterized protein YacL (UPF0231 family)